MNNIFKTGKSHNYTALLFCAGGVLLNLILNLAATAFELPIYLDTVGTIIIAVTGGYLPGVLVGFATNIIKGISSSSSLYYGVFHILIAIFAAYLSKRGWLKRICGVLGMIAVFALIGGGLGSVIPLLTNSISSDSKSLNMILYKTGIFDKTSTLCFFAIFSISLSPNILI